MRQIRESQGGTIGWGRKGVGELRVEGSCRNSRLLTYHPRRNRRSSRRQCFPSHNSPDHLRGELSRDTKPSEGRSSRYSLTWAVGIRVINNLGPSKPLCEQRFTWVRINGCFKGGVQIETYVRISQFCIFRTHGVRYSGHPPGEMSVNAT